MIRAPSPDVIVIQELQFFAKSEEQAVYWTDVFNQKLHFEVLFLGGLIFNIPPGIVMVVA